MKQLEGSLGPIGPLIFKMTIIKKTEPEQITIDTTGPNGNAYYLMAMAKRLAKQLDFNHEKIIDEMKSSDYENLIKVFDGYFGDYVILER